MCIVATSSRFWGTVKLISPVKNADIFIICQHNAFFFCFTLVFVELGLMLRTWLVHVCKE